MTSSPRIAGMSWLAAAGLVLAGAASAAPGEQVRSFAQREKPAVIETLRQLVAIESGSRDKEGLDRIAQVLYERLAALGGKVEFVGPGAEVGAEWSGLAEAASGTFWDPRPELLVLRRRGEADGWSLRSWPAALVYPEGVLFPEFTLQPADLCAHTGLSHMQSPRRPGEVRLFRDRDEVLELPKLHNQ